MKNYKILVTGATGFIGKCLVNRLLEEDNQIHVLTRNPDKILHEWKNKVSVIKADLSDESFQLPEETLIVFNCAGEIKNESKFEDTNVKGTQNIVKACLEREGCKLIHLSSVGVMGVSGNVIADENIACSPGNMYEKSKFAAEVIIEDAVRNSGLDAMILRPSIVYGFDIAREKDSFLALIRMIQKKRFFLIGKSSSYYNIVYVGDVVEALVFLSTTPMSDNKNIFIINNPILWSDFTEKILLFFGIDTPVIKIPVLVGYLLALICDTGRLLGIRTPFSLNRYRVLVCKTIFNSDRLREQAGFKFKYGNAEGLKNTLNQYLQKELLQKKT